MRGCATNGPGPSTRCWSASSNASSSGAAPVCRRSGSSGEHCSPGPCSTTTPLGSAIARHLSGIVVGQLLVDVPDRLHDPNRARTEAALAARSGGRTTMVVQHDADLDVAVTRAIELATN